MRRAARIAVSLAACLTFACTSGRVPLGAAADAAYDPGDRIDYTVTECGAHLLLFIPAWTNGRHERAMRAIRERAGDRYIADVRVRERWMYLVFGTIQCSEFVAATYGRR